MFTKSKRDSWQEKQDLFIESKLSQLPKRKGISELLQSHVDTNYEHKVLGKKLM